MDCLLASRSGQSKLLWTHAVTDAGTASIRANIRHATHLIGNGRACEGLSQ